MRIRIPDRERVRRRLRAETLARLEDVRPALWPTVQTALAAGAAWEIAHRGLGHDTPIFAAVTTVVSMGFRAGRRAQQAAIMAIGTAVGIGLADLFARKLPSGGPAIAVMVVVTTVLGLAISREPAFVSQVVISALLLVTVDVHEGLTPARLEDGLIGSGVAILVSLILFPIDPVDSVVTTGKPVFAGLAKTLEDAAAALRSGSLPTAERARARRIDDRELEEAVEVAAHATRIAPRRRRDRSRVNHYVVAATRVDALARGIRVVAGATHRVVREGGAPAPELAEPVDALASAIRSLSAWLEHNRDELRTDTRTRALRAAAIAAEARAREGLGPATITHLVQSLAGDVLRATGVRAAEVQKLLDAALR